MNNTYVVYAEEYYFSMNSFSTVMKKKVYNVSSELKSAEEVKEMIEDTLQKSVDSNEVNANNEMLTTFKVDVKCLEGELTIDEAKEAVIDDDYSWGKEGRSK